MTTKWEAVRKAHPHLTPLMDEAAGMIRALRTVKPEAKTTRQADDWEAIQRKLATPAVEPMGHRYRRLSYQWMAAAALLATIALGLYLFLRQEPMVEVRTAYGEDAEIALPDGSTLVLYPNSSIRYARQWNSGTPREVWLAGESRLDIARMKETAAAGRTHAPFKVYLNDSLSVTVLGTVFTVYNREARTPLVHLESGRVQVDRAGHRVVLSPGESVSYGQHGDLVKHSGPRAIARLPQTNELALHDAPLHDAIAYIAGNFGVTIQADRDFHDRHLDGIVPFSAATETLAVIAAIVDGQLTESGPGVFRLSKK